jgi:large subunit ribosomal protein L13
MKTISAKAEDVTRDWFVVDAADKTLGAWPVRLRTVCGASTRLNLRRMSIPAITLWLSTRKKFVLPAPRQRDKMYHHHTLYPGGLKSISFEN